MRTLPNVFWQRATDGVAICTLLTKRHCVQRLAVVAGWTAFTAQTDDGCLRSGERTIGGSFVIIPRGPFVCGLLSQRC